MWEECTHEQIRYLSFVSVWSKSVKKKSNAVFAHVYKAMMCTYAYLYDIPAKRNKKEVCKSRANTKFELDHESMFSVLTSIF